MAKPVYLYFNLRGRGELPRLVAAVGKIPYVDKRINLSDWPGQYKSKTPYRQLPTLQVEGYVYAQKLAISLFFARMAGLYPISRNPIETLKYDHILNFTEEILEQMIQALVNHNFNNKPKVLVDFKEHVLPKKIPLLEKLLEENSTGFFVGDKLSIVDLSAFDVTEHVIDIQGKSYLDSLPLLKAHFERVGENEEVKKYIASRPAPESLSINC